jgi:hypothetical protein
MKHRGRDGAGRIIPVTEQRKKDEGDDYDGVVIGEKTKVLWEMIAVLCLGFVMHLYRSVESLVVPSRTAPT